MLKNYRDLGEERLARKITFHLITTSGAWYAVAFLVAPLRVQAIYAVDWPGRRPGLRVLLPVGDVGRFAPAVVLHVGLAE